MAGTEKGDSSEIDSSTSKMCASSCGNDSQQGESSTNGTTVPADAAGTTQMEVEQSSAGCSSGDMDTEDPSTTKPTGGNVASGGAVAESSKNSVAQEQVEFKVIFNKTKLDITFALDNTIGQLKDHLSDITGVPNSMQKLMIKGLAKDCQTLREAGITKGLKVMMVGSKLNDILAVTTPSKQELEDKSSSSNVKEPFCKQKVHRKVLDKGMPDDAMPGILNTKEALPPYPLSGMLNKYGGKVRLTFKLELDQVWIGTKERTQKLAMNSIRGVVSEPIEGYEQYHILAIQLGPTEASRYWVYWVPVQYIDAIKDTIMGSWIM